jgi:hypothetical protein
VLPEAHRDATVPCDLTTQLSGRPRHCCRSWTHHLLGAQRRPTTIHGPLQRVVSCHAL